MFEDSIEKWTEYRGRHTPSWQLGDPRHSLGVEVHTRLRQLDLVLEYERAALEGVGSDPAEAQRVAEYMRSSESALESGEMSQEEYFAGIESREPMKDPALTLRAYEEVGLFAEAFYFFAGRIRDVLRKSGFPGLRRFEAVGVRNVRNLLLQHPGPGHLGMALLVTSVGPSLKTMTATVGGDPPDFRPTNEHLDQGLWVNVAEFHDELNRRLDRDAEDHPV